ncbi:MAG: hypothetical protein SH859_11360 [Hyphomicrobium aestuarii]|nr:hypothetical protein [Hyphomicrobium aestuarii]
MTSSLKLNLNFEFAADSEAYEAGLRGEGSRAAHLALSLPAEAVEPLVLAKAQLSISLSPSGVLTIHPDGVSDEILRLLMDAKALPTMPLSEVIRRTLNPELLAPDEDAVEDLAKLRQELETALQLTNEALANIHS